jgi:hypothetical protein
MIRVATVAFFLPALAQGQWESVGGGTMAGEPRTLLFDPTSERLYAVGDMRYMVVDTLQVNGTAMWDGAIWRPLGGGVSHPFSGLVPQVQSICKYDSGYVVVGAFLGMAGVPNTRVVAKWQNGSWHSCGLDSLSQPYGNAIRLLVIDDTLNMLGGDAIVYQGDTIRSWAKYDGEHWYHGDASEEWIYAISSLCRYQGVMYAGGNLQLSGGRNDLVRKGPNGWEELGQGLLGDPWVNDLVEYDGLLWVVGEFYQSAGNAASGLMAWDGNQWLNPFPQLNFTSQGRDFEVANGKLYFSGAMQVQGLVGEYRIGVYDGDQVCILGGPDVWMNRIAVSADTLYGATCKYLFCANQGQQVNSIAKWPLNAPPDACFDVEVGIQEQSLQGLVQLWPNPVLDVLHLNNPQPAYATIIDATGRQVMVVQVPAQGAVPVAALASGCYVLHLRNAQQQPFGVVRFAKE